MKDLEKYITHCQKEAQKEPMINNYSSKPLAIDLAYNAGAVCAYNNIMDFISANDEERQAVLDKIKKLDVTNCDNQNT